LHVAFERATLRVRRESGVCVCEEQPRMKSGGRSLEGVSAVPQPSQRVRRFYDTVPPERSGIVDTRRSEARRR
jgi:hypothetical protein